MSSTRLRIVLAGSIAGAPGHGGWTWVVLQYALGLRRLGHDVYLIDPLDPVRLPSPAASLSASANATYFRKVVRRFGLEDAATLLLTADPPQSLGRTYGDLLVFTSSADLLINMSGVLHDEVLLMAARRRVYLDLDPAFTQLWHEAEGIDMGLERHTDFVTIGLAVGATDCPVPTCGLPWITTPQPIVLERWPMADERRDGAFTTVANWRGYGSINHEGVHYGQKVHAFRSLLSLPRLADERFELALGIHPDETADLEALAAHGWGLVDPVAVAGDPDAYQQFVHGSKGEFGVAKTGYIASRCGWFSDRSICYLASGRPVVAQDTGFGASLSERGGVLPFETVDEARDAVERVRLDYGHHARAARDVAETYFESDKVLTSLIDRLGTSP